MSACCLADMKVHAIVFFRLAFVRYLSTDDVPEAVVEKEKAILAEEALQSGKPADKVCCCCFADH